MPDDWSISFLIHLLRLQRTARRHAGTGTHRPLPLGCVWVGRAGGSILLQVEPFFPLPSVVSPVLASQTSSLFVAPRLCSEPQGRPSLPYACLNFADSAFLPCVHPATREGIYQAFFEANLTVDDCSPLFLGGQFTHNDFPQKECPNSNIDQNSNCTYLFLSWCPLFPHIPHVDIYLMVFFFSNSLVSSSE